MHDPAHRLQFALFVAAGVAGMVAFGHAARPLYDAFHAATEPPGATDMVAAAPLADGDIIVTLRYEVDRAVAPQAAQRGIGGIVLSYTFFHAAGDGLAAPAVRLSSLPVATAASAVN